MLSCSSAPLVFAGALMVATLKIISSATNLSDSFKDEKVQQNLSSYSPLQFTTKGLTLPFPSPHNSSEPTELGAAVDDKQGPRTPGVLQLHRLRREPACGAALSHQTLPAVCFKGRGERRALSGCLRLRHLLSCIFPSRPIQLSNISLHVMSCHDPPPPPSPLPPRMSE